jgi:hypothetical protein
MARVLMTRERVLVAVEMCVPDVAQQWTTFLGPLFRLSAVTSQYSETRVFLSFVFEANVSEFISDLQRAVARNRMEEQKILLVQH